MAKPKLVLLPATQGSKLYSVLPADGVGDFTFSRNSAATRINKDGLIETVAVGKSRLNYPLIDGKVVGCPSHLLEPSRTNLITYSEDFSQTSFWNANSNVTILKNYKSPNGTLNASKIIPNTTNSQHSIKATGKLTNSRHNYTIYVKASGNSFFQIANQSTADYVNFNLNNGTYFASNSNDEVSVDYFGDGWYKCNVYFATAFQGIYNVIIENIGSTRLEGFVGNDVDGIYIWGAQAEQGSFPTSYIPNYGTSAGITRSAETANGAGDASTFNDSEGVLMAEISALDNDLSNRILSLSNGAYNNSTRIGYNTTSNSIEYRVVSSSSIQAQLIYALPDIKTNNKISVKYKSNDFALWVNGFKVDTDPSGLTSIGLDRLNFDDGGGSADFYGNVKQIQYFDTALNDSDLETITSWVSFNDMANSQLYSIK